MLGTRPALLKASQVAALVVAVMLHLAGAAAAQQYYQMSGTWTTGISVSGTDQLVETQGTVKVITTGSVPALVFPDKVWEQEFESYNFPVPTQPQTAQVFTSGSGYNRIAKLEAGGGPGSFAFCPGPNNPVNPNCLNPGQATGGTAQSPPTVAVRNGIVQYTAGPRQFGGSMRFLTFGSSTQSFISPANPPVKSTTTVFHIPIPAATRAAVGSEYANQILIPFGVPQITINPVLSSPYGRIQTGGTLIGTGTTTDLWPNTGFPWTTGTVAVMESLNPPGQPNSTITVSGTWGLDSMGLGNISLVAGGVNDIIGQNSAFVSWGRQQITLAVPEPGQIAMLASGGLGLVLLGLGRRRPRG